jgi:2-polyprenyl-6-methoxyphenol hydroxylase-like FAD-dependent oxidoreductase
MLETSRTTCCIVGGGPAGVMTGYLLARSGMQVIILEKHKDFFRDFRGDTVHPSTLQLFDELGLLQQLLKIPHQEYRSISLMFGASHFKMADFSHLHTQCKFIALMPQWDLLNFLTEHGKQFPGFNLRLEHEVTGLIQSGGRVTGVEAKTPAGNVQITAELVIGCDGRHSVVRESAKMETMELGVPIDALWFRISRKNDDPETSLGNVNFGKALILINRGEYFQAGLIISKGSFDQIRQNSLTAFQHQITQIAPWLGDRVYELKDWDQIKLLSVQINRLKQWHRPGLLCIGDAAHAMSPAGGVGINLAVQDAVATANLLVKPLLEANLTEENLAQVQERREFPARVTQQVQVFAHKGIVAVFQNSGPAEPPWQLRLAAGLPGLPRLVGRIVGIGIRPEHVQTKPV